MSENWRPSSDDPICRASAEIGYPHLNNDPSPGDPTVCLRCAPILKWDVGAFVRKLGDDPNPIKLGPTITAPAAFCAPMTPMYDIFDRVENAWKYPDTPRFPVIQIWPWMDAASNRVKLWRGRARVLVHLVRNRHELDELAGRLNFGYLHLGED